MFGKGEILLFAVCCLLRCASCGADFASQMVDWISCSCWLQSTVSYHFFFDNVLIGKS